MSSLCDVTYNQCSLEQMKLSISMTSLITFSRCLVMLCILVYFLGHFWITNVLFHVNMYCRFFSISKFVNWVISDSLVHKDLNNGKFSHAVHMLLSLIICLVLLKNRKHGLSVFTNPCITFVFTSMLKVSF